MVAAARAVERRQASSGSRTARRSRRMRCSSGREPARRSSRRRVRARPCSCVDRRAHLYRLAPTTPSRSSRSSRCRSAPSGWARTVSHRSASTAPEDRRRGDRGLPAVRLPQSRRTSKRRGELPRRLPSAHVVASHEVAPEFREYERARRPPPTHTSGRSSPRYLRALGRRRARQDCPEPLVMRSSGGVATIDEAAEHPA